MQTKVPGNKSSTCGTFVPGNESCLVRKFQLPVKVPIMSQSPIGEFNLVICIHRSLILITPLGYGGPEPAVLHWDINWRVGRAIWQQANKTIMAWWQMFSCQQCSLYSTLASALAEYAYRTSVVVVVESLTSTSDDWRPLYVGGYDYFVHPCIFQKFSYK